MRKPGRIVVVDEAFMEMVPGEPGSLANAAHLDDVVVVRSLTKILSIPGVRAGYALAAPPLAEALEAAKPPWSANALALRALTAAAMRPHELAALAERAAAERADLERRLSAIEGVRVWPSATNYVLIEVDDGPPVVTALRNRQIAVRPAASFPGLHSGHIRLTARDREANTRLVAALAEAL
jgi:histidinol-phosphate/aromatic aminotransferase/cobyric acid decarboxylase-like protein